MNNLIHREERKVRINKKLKSIEEFYNLAFETKEKSGIKIQSYKGEFILIPNEKELTKTAKKLAKDIKEISKLSATNSQLKNLADRLTIVHSQLVEVVRDEFRTLRNRNNRISTIED